MHGGKIPNVVKAAKQRIMEAADPAAAKLVLLLDSEDERISLAAARDLLDRAGHKPPTEVKGQITIESAVAIVEEEIRNQRERQDGD